MGRLPVKVNLRGGPIGIGDWITASDEPGVAMRASGGGIVLGRALEPYDGTTTSTILATIEVSSRMGEGAISAVTSTELSWKDAANAVIARSMRTAQELVGGFFDMLVAQVASIGKLFVHTATILPNGSLSVPSGPREMSGKATVPAGVADVFIENTRITSSSKIFISPLVPLTAPLVVTEKKEGQGFRVSFSSAQGIPAPFDWIIFEGYGGGDESVISGATSATPPSSPSPSPAPTPTPSEENTSSSDASTSNAPTLNTSSSDIMLPQAEASSTESTPLP
jgi:hypothetical protein